MKMCIDGIIQEVETPENEPVFEKPATIEDELADIKTNVNKLVEMLTPLIKHLGG